MSNENTKSIKSKPQPVNGPADIITYRQSLLDLTGLDIGDDSAEVEAVELAKAMLLPQEILADFYLLAVNGMMRALRTVSAEGRVLEPSTVWHAASRVRSEAKTYLRDRIRTRRHAYSSYVYPLWSRNEFVKVQLLPGVSINLDNDLRNTDAITCLLGAAGSHHVLSPGESMIFTPDTMYVELMGAPEPSRLTWTRVGGSYVVGGLKDTIPQASVETPVETPAKKKGWFR